VTDPEVDNGSNVLVRFHEIKHDTGKATLLLLTPSDTQGVWIPNSQIAHIDDDTGEVWIPLWLAEKNGMEYE